MKSPMISVVMSVFNGERFLVEAIDSILDQSFADFEFLVIDDGSTDGTAAILDSYQGRDSRMRIDRQENRGLVDALNRGFALASGKYVARMDADDIAKPERLGVQVDFMETHSEVSVVGSVVEFIDSEGKLLDIECELPLSNREIQTALPVNCVIWHPTVMIRKATLEAVGQYRKVPEAEDYDLWLRIAEHSELVNLPMALLRYRIHPAQVSAAKCGRQVLGAMAARASASSRRSGKPDLLDFDKEITAQVLAESGVSIETIHTATAGAYLTAIRNMCRAGEYSFALKNNAILRSHDCRQAKRWILADSHLWAARAYWHEKMFAMGLLNVVRAVLVRPVTLGRPLKAVFLWVRSKLRNAPAPFGESAQLQP